MANLRTERLITAVFTLHNGDEITATDTADSRPGSGAMDQFMRGATVRIDDGSNTTYVPFHAIIKVVVSSASQETEFEDDFCKED